MPNTTAQGKQTLITLTLDELAKVLIMNIGPTRFSYLPDVVKNLLIINALFFFKIVLESSFGLDLDKLFGLHNWQSPDFRPHQLVTHLFIR